MMKFEIKHRYTHNVLFACDAENMRGAVLEAIKSDTNLSRADLSGADLYGAYLYGADLSRADLSGADLYGANLYGAILSRADLSGANLYGAILSRADLSGANLYGANLSGSDLSDADLYGAYLYGADLSGSDLSGAILSGADLSGADLSDAKNSALVIARTQICPQEGAFVGWKKLKGGILAKLVIPNDAKRLNALSARKCRASKAFVHEIFDEAKEAFDTHTGKLLYKEGCEVIPDSFDEDIRVECSNGIHFFMTREEAEAN